MLVSAAAPANPLTTNAAGIPTVSAGLASTSPFHPYMAHALTAASMEAALSTQKDTTFTKIFVGGLPYHTTDKSLREHFEVYGEIEEAVVITDRQTGKSRGYGFVTMADRSGADRATKDPNPVIDGRKANVNLAYLGAKPRGTATSAAYSAIGGYHTGNATMRVIPTQHLTSGHPAYSMASQAASSYYYPGMPYSGTTAAHFPFLATAHAPQLTPGTIPGPPNYMDYIAASYGATGAIGYPAAVPSAAALEQYIAIPPGVAGAISSIPAYSYPSLSHATAVSNATALAAGTIPITPTAGYPTAAPAPQPATIQEAARM